MKEILVIILNTRNIKRDMEKLGYFPINNLEETTIINILPYYNNLNRYANFKISKIEAFLNHSFLYKEDKFTKMILNANPKTVNLLKQNKVNLFIHKNQIKKIEKLRDTNIHELQLKITCKISVTLKLTKSYLDNAEQIEENIKSIIQSTKELSDIYPAPKIDKESVYMNMKKIKKDTFDFTFYFDLVNLDTKYCSVF